MRIEYQGVVESQPTYQHVGYIAAATHRLEMDKGTGGLSLAMVFAGAALALMAVRRAKRLPKSTVARLALIAPGLIIAGAALAAAHALSIEEHYLRPDAVTHIRMRSIASQAGAQAEETGRVPQRLQELQGRSAGMRGPSAEWDRDAWGTPLRYTPLAEPDHHGRVCRLISAGPDLQFDTGDDMLYPASRR